MQRIAIVVRLLFLAVLAALVLIVLNPVLIHFSVERYIYHTTDNVPQTDVALVLGASVVRGKPSPVLEERANAAVELYHTRKVRKILVTGDNGALTHDEVTPVRKYLISAGIPAEDIFLDHAGFDTYSSMYRARDVFLAKSVIVVTQDFHMPRALFIARRLGLEAYGVVPKRGEGTGKDYLREIPASAKALKDLVLMRIPKYLGETYPLDGDGSRTWY